MQMRNISISFLVSAMLVACGGGGGDNDGASVGTSEGVSPIRGAWQGIGSNQQPLRAIVLDSGETWMLAGGAINTAPSAQLRTTLQAVSGSLTADDVFYVDYASATYWRGKLKGNYVVNSQLSASLQLGGNQAGLDAQLLTPVPAGVYNYEKPAVMGDIVGDWTTATARFTVTSAGIVKAKMTNGCEITGIVEPHANKRNVFWISLFLGDAPCSLPGRGVQGIAVPLGEGVKAELLIAAQEQIGGPSLPSSGTIAALAAYASRP